MRKSVTVMLSMLALSLARLASAQSSENKPQFGTQLVESDSLSLSDVAESPDGRWLLFASSIRSGPSHLWIMPSSGGAPRALTSGAYDDLTPVWFASGRRIAFQSSRVRGVMTADIDPVAGRLIGTPKRVSLEEAHTLDVSPDGSRIVYVDQRNRLRLIPSVGGPAVTILDHSGAAKQLLTLPRFSRDGGEVYVSSRDPDRRMAILLRVPVRGGAATTAVIGPPDGIPWSITSAPAHNRVVTYTPTKTALLTLKGDTIATMPPLRAGIYANFSRDGRRLYKATSVFTSIVRVLPTAGGKPIDVTNGKTYDYPLTWSADSKRLYSSIGDTSITKSKRGLYVTALDGTAPRFLAIGEIDTALAGPRMLPRAVAADGRYWWFTPLWWRPPFNVVAYDTKENSAHLVTRTAMGIVTGPGGFNVGSTLYYIEQGKGDRPHELRSLSGDEPSRALHSFTRLGAPWRVAINGDRLAFGVRIGDSTVLYTARLMGSEQRLTAVGGDVANLSWSPDGKALAAVVSPTKSGNVASYTVLFVQVLPDGMTKGTPRFVPTEAAWDLHWLPDSRAVLVLEEQGNTEHTRVLRVPMDEGQQPVSLTANEKRTFWDQYPSPDGRYVALPVEQFSSSTLWSIDVEAAAKAWRDRKRQPSSRPSAQ